MKRRISHALAMRSTRTPLRVTHTFPWSLARVIPLAARGPWRSSPPPAPVLAAAEQNGRRDQAGGAQSDVHVTLSGKVCAPTTRCVAESPGALRAGVAGRGRLSPKTARSWFVGQFGLSQEAVVNDVLANVEVLSQEAEDALQVEVLESVQCRLSGGSSWLSPRDIPESVFAAQGPYVLRIGVLDGTNIPLTYSGEGSLITIAPPGSGKTQCFVLPNMLSWPGAAVVLDVKGEIYEATSRWRAANVGPVYKFSPLDPSTSHSYNPLVFVRQDPEYLWEDARFLADMLVVPSGASDPFWENMARDVVTAALAYVVYENSPEQRPMSKVMDLLYGIGWDPMGLALKTNLESSAMRQTGHSLEGMEKKMRDSVLKSAQSSMSAWQGDRLARVTQKSDWTPLDLQSQKGTLYICINPNEIDSYLSVLRVVIAQHIRMLTSRLQSRDAAPPPMLFMLDELPRLKKMPPIDEALSIGRQYGIRLWMFAQSYGQLEEAYPNAEGMLGSCAVRTFMNVPLNDEMAQKLSDMLGYREGVVDNARTKLVEPLELAGPKYRDLVLVLATNTPPARVRKAFAHQDSALTALMAPVAQ
jgi:type IV secretion system protein VirD4